MKRFILIGCGNWGERWVRDFIPETADVARCAAVVDVNREAAERAGLHLTGLGRRILRTETAAPFVLSCLAFRYEL